VNLLGTNPSVYVRSEESPLVPYPISGNVTRF
ncbi:uncharacterized protein METZ01_LOCUS73369, partial [marine metagenome]